MARLRPHWPIVGLLLLAIAWPHLAAQQVATRHYTIAAGLAHNAVTAIFQDEPTNTLGDGTTWVDGGGVAAACAWVRAERTVKNPRSKSKS